MAFPASPSDNDVHKEGNRSFVYDSTLGVWDRLATPTRLVDQSRMFPPTFSSINLQPTQTTAAPTGSQGKLYFDYNKGALMQYDGTEWVTTERYTDNAHNLTTGSGGVISSYTPVGTKSYRVHAFYTSGIFTLYSTRPVDIMIAGGGGGGGGRMGGGGGGGAYYSRSNYDLPAGTYNITIGAGGHGGTNNSTPGEMGGSTVAFGVTAYGGGPGKTRFATNLSDTNRANGGGSAYDSTSGLTGTALPVTGWTFGGNYTGGDGSAAGSDFPQGGGGGADGHGEDVSGTNAGGFGGAGEDAAAWITPEALGRQATTGTAIRTAFYFCAGGGGSRYGSGGSTAGGAGGNGGGGGGGSIHGAAGVNGKKSISEDTDGDSTAGSGGQGARNSGSGGGAGQHSGGGEPGGQGGSGCVIIRYAF